MSHRIVEIYQPLPEVITSIHSAEGQQNPRDIFATSNQDKLAEFARITGREVEGVTLKVPEVQPKDPTDWRTVVEEKAIAAYEAFGRKPVIVEDASLEVAVFDGRPGVFADQFTGTVEARNDICTLVKGKNDRRATARVAFAIFDGKQVHVRMGETTGTIADSLRGNNGFGWDDMFEPDGQEELSGWNEARRTFAEMSSEEKDALSMRRIALEKLKEDPFKIGRWVYKLPEPYQMQLNAVDGRLFRNSKARKHAYSISALEESSERKDGKVAARTPFHEIVIGPGIKRYVKNPQSANLGIVVTPIDTAINLDGDAYRLKVDNRGEPVFWEMGDEAVRMALAARAQEFELFHNPKAYALYRQMMSGEIQTPLRANRHSDVIEALLEVQRSGHIVMPQSTAASIELGYVRQYSPREMSRTKAANYGLFLTSTGIPTSIFALGGMPPVTGSADVLATSALSLMDSYVPRNSIYAGNLDIQLQLFQEAKQKIEVLQLPTDIEQMIIAHIGIAVGAEDPKKIAKDIRRIYQAGCRSVRFYTTNPDVRVVTSARQARDILGQKWKKDTESITAARQMVGGDMRFCVGPIVDIQQAMLLIGDDSAVNTVLAGHGGGENCTSLIGGGAANSLELVYRMSLLSEFNQTAIGLEGGTGSSIGALLGFIDVISLNRRGVAGGIEAGEGLFVELANGEVGQPYWGSASPPTQWVEAQVNPEIAKKRLDRAGRLKNNEGKPNYMVKPRSVYSIVNRWSDERKLAGTALADQDALSINELRAQITKNGYPTHRKITGAAAGIAKSHRGGN